jgi:hypothetical protein
VGSNDIATRLSENQEFVKDVAMKANTSLPIGTILIWWGVRSNIPSGWAPCDGTHPEPTWPETTPNLTGKVLVGMKAGDKPSIKEAHSINIPEPARELEAGGDAKLNWGLLARNWLLAESTYRDDFYERVKKVIPRMEDHILNISAENLPRGEVYFIIRYK